jgi:HD-like signal output (HDOD) protein
MNGMLGGAWTARAGEADMTAVLAGSVRDIGIPPRPAILTRIEAEMDRPEPDFRQLARLISADVGIAASLLKIANSAYFGFTTPARTVSQALMMLGLEVTAHAVAGLLLRRVFADVPALDRFWDASARIARTSGWLAQRLGIRNGVRSDDAYTFGLFRDCGIPILMRRLPDYRAVLREANAEAERGFTAVELSRCPTHHALVGCLMAQDWRLPEEMCAAIRHHHDAIALGAGEPGMPAPAARLAALAQLTEYLVQRIGGRSATREWEKLGNTCLNLLGINGLDIEVLVRDGEAVATASDD